MVWSVFGKVLRFNGFKAASNHQRLFGQLAYETHPHILEKGQVTPGITKTEYFKRRCELMKKILQANSYKPMVAVIPSAGKLYMAPDVPYSFRQNADFLYLCGFKEPDSILVMTNIGCEADFQSLLFVPKRDKLRELWDGPRTGSERAVVLTGCDKAHNVDDFEQVITSLLKNVKSANLWYDEENAFHSSSHKQYMKCFNFEKKLQNIFPIKKFIQNMRIVKSEAEIVMMKHSCKLGSESMEEVMKFSRPMVDENHLEAKMDFECRVRGAERLAYPPVVAGGNRANIIHYISNNQIIRDGEMVLMDAGCDYHGYCSDITRTWPINGRFSPAQRELYEALLEVQMSCIQLCRADRVTLNELFVIMLTHLGKQLQRLNIISKDVSSQNLPHAASTYCPHHIGHYLGMDVHDVDEMSRTTALRPGTIITVEPGIYIPQGCEEAPKHFRGIGIRIEDNILITSGEPINLTDLCPKHPDDIERTVNCGR